MRKIQNGIISSFTDSLRMQLPAHRTLPAKNPSNTFSEKKNKKKL